jgi:hypothetical protein
MTLKTPSTSGIRTLARVLMHDMHSGRSVIRAVTIAVLSGTVPPRDAARRRSGVLLVLPRIAAMPRAVGRKKVPAGVRRAPASRCGGTRMPCGAFR